VRKRQVVLCEDFMAWKTTACFDKIPVGRKKYEKKYHRPCSSG